MGKNTIISKYEKERIKAYFNANGVEKEKIGFEIYPILTRLAIYVANRYYSTNLKKYGDDMIDAAVSRLMCSKVEVSRVKNIYSYCFTSFKNSYYNYNELKMNKINILYIGDYNDIATRYEE